MPSSRIQPLSALRSSRTGGLRVEIAEVSVVERGGLDVLRVAPGGDDVRELSLTPDLYRSVAAPAAAVAAGPGPVGAAPAAAAPWGFGDPHALMTFSRGDEDEGLSLSRHALASFLEAERPIEMARASRMARDELADPRVAAMDPSGRAAEFERRWEADAVASRVDAVLVHAPDRVRRDPGGREVVTLWVRRDDVGAAQGRGLAASPLAAAVDQPEWGRRHGGADRPTGAVLPGLEGLRHLEETFGSSSGRRVHLDVARVSEAIVGLPPSRREEAFSLLSGLAQASAGVAASRGVEAAPAPRIARPDAGLDL